MTRLIGALVMLIGISSSPAARSTGQGATPVPPTPPTTRGAPKDGTSRKPLSVDAFNARLAAAGDSAWAKAPATIAIEFVGGADGECARSSIEVTSRPERFDEADVTVTRDGFLDDSIRGDLHRLRMRRGPERRWRVVSAGVSWLCWPGRGQEDHSADPCR